MLGKKMNPLSVDLGNYLLSRHSNVCGSFKGNASDVPEELIQKAVIPYKALLQAIGAPDSLAESIGTYLVEVAEWCHTRS